MAKKTVFDRYLEIELSRFKCYLSRAFYYILHFGIKKQSTWTNNEFFVKCIGFCMKMCLFSLNCFVNGFLCMKMALFQMDLVIVQFDISCLHPANLRQRNGKQIRSVAFSFLSSKKSKKLKNSKFSKNSKAVQIFFHFTFFVIRKFPGCILMNF